jgi:hypothetical protein
LSVKFDLNREIVLKLIVSASISSVPVKSGKTASSKAVTQDVGDVGRRRADLSMSSVRPEMPPPKTISVGINSTGATNVVLNQRISVLCVSVIEKLTNSCVQGEVAVAAELLESFSVIPLLDSSSAGRLVTALGTLFPLCPGLADRQEKNIS